MNPKDTQMASGRVGGEVQAAGTPMGALVDELTAVMGGNDVLAAHGKLMTALKNVQAEMQVLQMEKRNLEDDAKYTTGEVTRLYQSARQHELTAKHYRSHRDTLEEALMVYVAASERDQTELKSALYDRDRAVNEVAYLNQRIQQAQEVGHWQAQQVDQLSQALAAANGALAEAEDKLVNGTVKTEDPENRPSTAKPADPKFIPLDEANPPVNTQSPQTAFEKQMAEEDTFRAKLGIQAAEEKVKEGYFSPRGYTDGNGLYTEFLDAFADRIEGFPADLRDRYETWRDLPSDFKGSETEAANWLADPKNADVE